MPNNGVGLFALVLIVGCGSPVYVRTASFDGGAFLDGAVERNGSGGTPAGSGGTGSGGILGGSGGAGGSGGTPTIGTGGAGAGGIFGGGGKNVAEGGAGGAATGGNSGGSAGRPEGTGGATASGGVGTGGVVATGGGGSSTGGKGSGGSGTGGATGGGGAAAVDNARYNFESSVQSWAAATGTSAFASIAISTTQHAAGQSSLAGAIVASAAATYQLHVQPTTAVAAGSTVTFHVFYPSGAPMAWVQPYGIGGASTNYAWYGSARSVPGGTWNTLTVAIPSTGAAAALGVQFELTGPWTGTVYVDAVNW